MSLVQAKLSWEKRPLAEVLRLSWPAIVSLLSLSLMTFVDTLFMGWLGSVELAAVGLGGACTYTVICFGISVLGAAKVKVGEQHGQGNQEFIRRSLGAFLRFAVWLGTISVLVGHLAAESLPWLTTDPKSGVLAAEYSQIRALGFPLVLVGSAVGQWLQAQGNTRASMNAALLANLANIPLNALFIFGLGGGVQGAAIATLVSGALEAGYLLYQQRTNPLSLGQAGRTQPGLHWNKSSWRDSLEVLRVGFPTGLERVLDMMAFAAVPLLLSRVGPVEVAAHQIVLQICLLSFLPLHALSDTIAVLISQAVGANLKALADAVNRLGLRMAVGYGLVCAGTMVLFAPQLAGLFSHEYGLRQVTRDTLLVGALLQLLNAPYIHFKGVLRGLSAFRYSAWVAVGCAWIITPPLTYVWGVLHGYGAKGAWTALCVEVTLGVALCAWRATWRAHPGATVSVATASQTI